MSEVNAGAAANANIDHESRVERGTAIPSAALALVLMVDAIVATGGAKARAEDRVEPYRGPVRLRVLAAVTPLLQEELLALCRG